MDVRRSLTATLNFPDREAFDDFRVALAEARCPLMVNVEALAISFPQSRQGEVEKVIEQLGDRYRVVISDSSE